MPRGRIATGKQKAECTAEGKDCRECVETNFHILCQCLDRVEKARMQSMFFVLYEADECRAMQPHFMSLYARRRQRQRERWEPGRVVSMISSPPLAKAG